ncbi:MAG: tetratricopeptide repeat protein [Acidobacteriota bacterium]
MNGLGWVRAPLGTLVLAVWAVVGVPLVQAQDCVQQGKDYLKEERIADALVVLDRCKQANQEDGGGYFYTGIALAANGNLVEAVIELGKAVELDPDNVEYALGLADILSGVGQWAPADEILQLFDQEDKVDQLAIPQLWLLSDLYYRSEKYERSLNMLDRIEAQDPEDARVHFRRGQIHMDGSNLNQALLHFRKAAEGMPDTAPPLFGAGIVLRLQNQLVEAKQEILRAVELEPSNVEFLWQLAEVCLGLNQPEQAIEYLEPLEDSDPPFVEVYRLLGEAHRRLGDQVRAQEYLDRVQAMRDSQQEAVALNEEVESVVARAEEKLQEGQIDEALGLFQEALTKAPGHWLAHSYLAKIYLSSGYPRLAYDHLSRMAELAPESVEGNYLMGQYWYQQRDFRQARIYAEKAKAQYPGSGVLRNLLGNVYMELGQRELAIEEYEAAVRLDPERPDFERNYQVLLRSR